MDRYRHFLKVCGIAAFTLVYVMFTGMVETFGARDIIANIAKHTQHLSLIHI